MAGIRKTKGSVNYLETNTKRVFLCLTGPLGAVELKSVNFDFFQNTYLKIQEGRINVINDSLQTLVSIEMWTGCILRQKQNVLDDHGSEQEQISWSGFSSNVAKNQRIQFSTLFTYFKVEASFVQSIIKRKSVK